MDYIDGDFIYDGQDHIRGFLEEPYRIFEGLAGYSTAFYRFVSRRRYNVLPEWFN
jgi:hypothetical protein